MFARYLSIFLLLLISHSIAFAQDGNPSAIPSAAMEKLDVLKGKWSSVMSISLDRGASWKQNEANDVQVSSRLKGMLLEQHNLSESSNGWNIMHNVAYDQYRQVYRQTVNDDTWGMMDVYEGNIESGKLVTDNLRSGTSFPGPNNTWLFFRLSVELDNCQRRTDIDVTLDEGEEWIPYIRYDFSRLDDEECTKK